MQVGPFLYTTFYNFWNITGFSTGNHRWVINAQTGPGFWPTLYIYRVALKPLYITQFGIVG